MVAVDKNPSVNKSVYNGNFAKVIAATQASQVRESLLKLIGCSNCFGDNFPRSRERESTREKGKQKKKSVFYGSGKVQENRHRKFCCVCARKLSRFIRVLYLSLVVSESVQKKDTEQCLTERVISINGNEIEKKNE